MNLKTTFALLVLVAAGAGGWYALTVRESHVVASKTSQFLDTDLKADALTKIEVERKGQPTLVLEKTGNEWSLPGKWPVRGPEVAELVRTLTTLHSRFAPIDVDKSSDLGKYGLGDKAIAVKLTVGGKLVGMKIGEESSESNKFTRASFLKLDDENQVVRLGPGLVAALDRPIDYFQQRRLFPIERVAKEGKENEKVDQIVAQRISVKGPAREKGPDDKGPKENAPEKESPNEVTLSKSADGWQIETPVKDHADPDKVKTLLAGLMDLWADHFISSKNKSPEETGLDKPEYEVTIERPGGAKITVQIGKTSSTKDRTVLKTLPAMPQFGGPPKQIKQTIKEEYRYAKLLDNDQLFEVKADKLAELTPSLRDIRDSRLARFKTDEVKKIEIDVKGQTIVLERKDDKWQMEKPSAIEAESGPVKELLEKLSSLEVRGDDIRDGADLKALGLDAPMARISLTLEEGKKDSKGPRSYVFSFGEVAKGKEADKGKETDKEKGKVFVTLADWPRVNVLEADAVKWVHKDALAYRRRRLLEAGSELAKIQFTRGGESFTFERKDGVWSQTAPTSAKLDDAKVERLVDDLGRLEAAEYVAAAPKAEELDKTYGLAKPATVVTLTFADDKKPPLTLALGGERPGKDESFARLADGPVFGLAKSTRDLLERDALSYRPTQVWQVKADSISELRYKREGESFSVAKDGERWKISGPFSEFARTEYLTAIGDELAQIKGDKYVAQIKDDLAKFGLDKPYLEIEVISAKGIPELKKLEKFLPTKKESTEVSMLQVGKLEPGSKSRYARIGSADAVFLLNEKALEIIDRGPLDLLSRVLVKLDSAGISQVRFGGAHPYTLERGKGEWQIVGSPAPAFKAVGAVADLAVQPWENLLASKIAAYGPKIDWASFGLETPESKVVVIGVDDGKKPVEHTVSLGKDAGGGSRFVRVDQRQEVAVIDAAVAKELTRSYLDFLDPQVLTFDFDAVTRITRAMKDGDLELVKTGDDWKLEKPTKQSADGKTIDDILNKAFRLKAVRFAEYPAKDLAKLGLAPPVATLTLDLGGEKPHVIKVGNAVDAKSEERYAMVDDGKAVFVLSAALSRHLTAPLLYFADRNVASFGGADRLELTRGDRKLVFVKSGPAWKLVEPVKADAEEPLAEFVQGLFRLRADEIVAAAGADLKAMGLEPPAAEWKVQSGGKDVLDLQIGAAKEGRRYARLAGGEQVFLLSPKQSAAAMAEYRSRKPWPPLDAVQVSSVVVGGDGAFTLLKRGTDWAVKDRPGDLVNEKTVTDLLDALASLKVDAYIADAKANLKLYGLDPAVRTIEVATAGGSRKLLLGRAEEGTGRLYAAVDGSDTVFLIGETESRRLSRRLAEYLQAK